MIHQYKSNGYNIVMDVNSGAVHVVDDVTYDAIELFEDISSSEIVDKLKDKYNESDILEAIDEIEELKKDGQLFTEDIYQPFVEKFKEQEQRRQAAALSLQGRTTGRAPAASMRHWLPCSLA